MKNVYWCIYAIQPRFRDNELNKKYSLKKIVSLYYFGLWKVRGEKLARSRHFSVKRHTSSQVAVRRDRAVFKKRISMQHAQSHVVFTAHSKSSTEDSITESRTALINNGILVFLLYNTRQDYGAGRGDLRVKLVGVCKCVEPPRVFICYLL